MICGKEKDWIWNVFPNPTHYMIQRLGTDYFLFSIFSPLIVFLPCINIFVFVDQNIWNIFPTAVAATIFYLLTCSTALIVLFIVGQPLDSLTA